MTENPSPTPAEQPAPGNREDVELPGSGPLEPAETPAPVAPDVAAGIGEPQPPGPDGQPAQTQADLEAAREAEQQAAADQAAEDLELGEDTPDPSAGVNDADVTAPNPYANPLGYRGKFAHGKIVTDDQADVPDDELQAGNGDQLDQPTGDQLDQRPPA